MSCVHSEPGQTFDVTCDVKNEPQPPLAADEQACGNAILTLITMGLGYELEEEYDSAELVYLSANAIMNSFLDPFNPRQLAR